jgi:hypothetical protein
VNLDITDKEMREGRARLREMLPDLRKGVSLTDPNGMMRPLTAQGQSVLGRVRFENLDALVIRRSVGGWHADVILTGMPVGVSNVMGTPEAAPLPSREEALRAGTGILRQLCRLAVENELAYREVPAKDTRPFQIHGHVFDMPGRLIDDITAVWGAHGRELVPDAEAARGQLTAALDRHMGGDRFDPGLFSALAEEDRGLILISMATLMVFGDFRHPERPQAEPAPEEDEVSP